MDIINTIQLHKNDFSKTEYKIYEYILQYPENVETYAITKIADLCQTSTSAVLRFCQVLGFKGYKDFRFEMVKYLHEHYEEKDTSDLFNQLTNEYMKALGQFKNLDRSLLNKLIIQLKEDNSIYILGIHYSALPAKELKFGLQDLGIMSFGAYDYIEAAHLSNTMNEDATLILFSMTGAKANFSRFLSTLNNSMPKKSYLITMNPNAQLSHLFSHTIVLPGHTFTNQSVVDTQAIPMIFVEMLLNLVHNSL
ncbi:MurR/RpiR family transcriptional regulator [Candidatus Stoquefichus massiliensis]|uniref:MurR/RpiR family transcriptional regulator n=1 Tax=Candidatus Stoquefichus massiliensis TaxID=1470350 RepID=UPI000480B521|nr:MurR/RpiR family transcriptional regulator [Candidatus Stoquefichus massiliensis]